jgi:3-dehydroquinate synthase
MLKFVLEDLPQETLKEFIIAGIKVKQQIVEADELEHGVRSYLNLGHTLAHAIEREMGYGKITHGEAVAIGLLFAIHVSENRYQVKLPFEELHSWLISNQYPVRSFSLDSDRLIHHMKSDKKAVKQQIKMVVLKAPGLLALEEVSDKELTGYLHTFKERLV